LKFAGFDVKYLRKHKGNTNYAAMMGLQNAVTHSLTDYLRDNKITHGPPLSDSEEEERAQLACGSAKKILQRVDSASASESD